MALPAAMVITKKIIVPAGQKEEELELQVEAEANQYIPFALDEVNLDFQILGPAPNNPDEVEVLIAASRKEKVEDRVAIAEAAGLKPRVMDVESYATQEAFELIAPSLPANGRDQNIALRRYRRARHALLRAAQRPVPVLPRPGVRRQPADPGHPARVQPVAGGGRVGQENQGLPENYDADVLQPFMETLALEVTAGAAVLLHLDPVQPGRPDRAGRRLRAASRPRRARRQARRRADAGRQPLRQHDRVRPDPAAAARPGRAAAARGLRPRAAELR